MRCDLVHVNGLWIFYKIRLTKWCHVGETKKLVKVDRASDVVVEVKTCGEKKKKRTCFIKRVCCRVCLAAVRGRDGEVEDVAVKLSVWMDGCCLHPKNRTFHSTASKWIGGLYKAICRMEDSTWKKLQLLKVLLRCLCRLPEGRADGGDSSGDCNLWNGSFWFWIVVKKTDQ